MLHKMLKMKVLLGRNADAVVIKDYPYASRDRFEKTPRATEKLVRILSKNEDAYAQALTRWAAHATAFEKIPLEGSPDGSDPFWNNGWIPALDAISIYGLIADLKPKTYMEVGSGNSTKFARRAIRDLGLSTRIVSIDPAPRASVDALCDEVQRMPLEDCDTSIFGQLGEGDILFVDNSHRAFQNSDVTVFFTEILPTLNPGVTYGLHDIFLPRDYPDAWNRRFYNEQYMLQAYLLGGADGDEIVMPCAHVADFTQTPAIRQAHGALFAEGPLKSIPHRGGGCFWMKRG